MTYFVGPLGILIYWFIRIFFAKNINLIEEIETPKIDYKIFNNLAYGQWTLKEIESGEAWEKINAENY